MAKKKHDLDASTAPAPSAPSIWNVNVIMNLVTSALDAFSNPLWGGLIFAQYIFKFGTECGVRTHSMTQLIHIQ